EMGAYQARANGLAPGPLAEIIASHLRPRPRVAEGRWLGEAAGVHAMMDCSDGIATDLEHICRESGVGARVRLDGVPVAPAARAAGHALGVDPREWAVGGGEDYELMLISALLSGAEAAYFSLGRTRLRELAEQQGQTPGPLAPLLAQPHDLLVTLLVGITVVNIGASALAAAIAGQIFGSTGLAIAIAGMVFLLTVFGEVLPMTLAVEHPLHFAAWVNRPVAWLSVLLRPIRAGLGAFTAITLRLVGSERQAGRPEISEEELR